MSIFNGILQHSTDSNKFNPERQIIFLILHIVEHYANQLGFNPRLT